MLLFGSEGIHLPKRPEPYWRLGLIKSLVRLTALTARLFLITNRVLLRSVNPQSKLAGDKAPPDDG